MTGDKMILPQDGPATGAYGARPLRISSLFEARRQPPERDRCRTRPSVILPAHS